MPARPILVADDEQNVRTALFEILTRLGHAVDLAENGAEALEKFKAHPFDLVITDIRMPRMDGMEVLRRIKKTSPQTPVLIVTAYGTVDNAVEAMREGAFDYILKPFSLDLIEETVVRALNGHTRPAARGPIVSGSEKRPIITQDPGLKRLLDMARSVAPSLATVLIRGETGTGKELVARFIHHNSDRTDGPFVAVNCASLPEGLLESELFGHEKGSFTGAVARKIGKFELAHQGTILLDEISEMDMALQAKLLRVLQENEIDRVGGKTPVPIDVRVLATTNRDLKDWVSQGKFRQDLYYRLNVIPLAIPPLRERPGDIQILAAHFLKKYALANGREIKRLSKSVLSSLRSMNWPGNVRELENIIARGVLLAQGPEVAPADLFLEEAAPPASSSPDPASKNNGELMTIREMERGLIEKALTRTDGNRTHAAKILGISVRTLRNKLAEYKSLNPAAGKAA
ncbi:MAG: sigma-54 dependent transcriptional regulator [Thermodesulfobacteriota bacterium]|nr:sigma-54 dependent transcriptional regulator [Thermodesulfobacteriota bacterium]